MLPCLRCVFWAFFLFVCCVFVCVHVLIRVFAVWLQAITKLVDQHTKLTTISQSVITEITRWQKQRSAFVKKMLMEYLKELSEAHSRAAAECFTTLNQLEQIMPDEGGVAGRTLSGPAPASYTSTTSSDSTNTSASSGARPFGSGSGDAQSI